MKKFIAYYRVSTDRQGFSGLGLEAQQQAVEGFLRGHGTIIAQYTEIESGKKNNRPQLLAALDACKREKAVLLIAKLDRLARNVFFISGLLESKVEFQAVDMPEANKLTIHILAAVAEHEREMISTRTKQALQAAKRRGIKLGSPHPIKSLRKAQKANKQEARAFAHDIAQYLLPLMKKRATLEEMALWLNRKGIKTRRGKSWYPASVRRIVARIQRPEGKAA